MNEPIISPWLIYFLFHLWPALRNLVWMILSFGGLTLFYLGIYWAIKEEWGEKVAPGAKKAFWGTLGAVIFSILFLAFTPSSRVLVAMLISKQITPATLKKVERKGDKAWQEFRKFILNLAKEGVYVNESKK